MFQGRRRETKLKTEKTFYSNTCLVEVMGGQGGAPISNCSESAPRAWTLSGRGRDEVHCGIAPGRLSSGEMRQPAHHRTTWFALLIYLLGVINPGAVVLCLGPSHHLALEYRSADSCECPGSGLSAAAQAPSATDSWHQGRCEDVPYVQSGLRPQESRVPQPRFASPNAPIVPGPLPAIIVVRRFEPNLRPAACCQAGADAAVDRLHRSRSSVALLV